MRLVYLKRVFVFVYISKTTPALHDVSSGVPRLICDAFVASCREAPTPPMQRNLLNFRLFQPFPYVRLLLNARRTAEG